MMKQLRHSFGWKLAILITIAGLVPLYSATWYFYDQARGALYAQAVTKLEARLQDETAMIERMLSSAASGLKMVSSFPLFYKSRDGRTYSEVDWSEEERSVLRRIQKRLGDALDEACVINPDGSESNRVSAKGITPPEHLSHDEYLNPFFGPAFQQEEGQVYQGPPYVSRDTNRWVIPFATPIVDPRGKKVAILHFEVNLHALRQLLNEGPFTGTSFSYLADADSRLIASSEEGAAADQGRPAGAANAEDLSMPVLDGHRAGLKALIDRAATQGGSAGPVIIRVAEEEYLVLVSPIETITPEVNRWFLVVGMTKADIFTGLDAWKYWGFAALATVLLGLTALLVGRWVSRPIADLYYATMRIATGELDVDIPEYRRVDEMGALNAAFRTMMGGIRALVKNLEQSGREIEDAKASAERKSREMVIKNLELVTHRQELQRRNEALTQITAAVSELIMVAAEKKSFDIRYRGHHEVSCWSIMEGCDSACPAYGSTIYVCRSEGGGPCCRDKETGAPPPIRQCIQCPVYRTSHPDEMSVVGENFNIMMDILQGKSQELDETKKQLIQSEKMSSIGQLAAGVAHEINNPIGFISSNMTTLSEYMRDLRELVEQYSSIREKVARGDCNAVQKDFARIDDFWKSKDMDFVMEDLDKVVQETHEGAKRVARIVKNLKEFSHVDEAEWKPADINEGLESTLSIIWNELKYKATVVKEYGDIPQVECYPMQLNQVFMNLLVNAAQAIPEKGEIRIRTWREGGNLCVAISDTGTGIPDDVRSKIFNPFFTTKGVGKGTGLGLSIAYGIIEQHKGSIKVDSTVGVGTTFTIRLPLSPQPAGSSI